MTCFGQLDENGKRYIPVEWAKTMIMHGVFPKGWKQRGPGNPQGNTWTREALYDTMCLQCKCVYNVRSHALVLCVEYRWKMRHLIE